jgi:hypothetical protein
MSAYLPQPDNSNACCDCPTRVSPCDDCVVSGCSSSCTTFTLVFTGGPLDGVTVVVGHKLAGTTWIGYWDCGEGQLNYNNATGAGFFDVCCGARGVCGDTDNDWSVSSGPSPGSYIFLARGTGNIPLGTPISSTVGAGTVTISCSGTFGACCGVSVGTHFCVGEMGDISCNASEWPGLDSITFVGGNCDPGDVCGTDGCPGFSPPP